MLVAGGVATATPSLVLGGVVPLAYVLTGAVGSAPDVAGTVRVERELSVESPLPGQPVEVTLTVENVGEAALADVRAVDGVPSELGVASGEARTSGPLRPGAALSTTYTLVADRGTFGFDDVAVRARTLDGTRLTDAALAAEGDDRFTCRVDADDVPVRQDTTAFAGQLATDTGGPGIEFHATREYQPGDPVRRVDWTQYAKTNELATVEYREQRATRVAVVVDSRSPAHVAPAASLPTGATLCAYAATLALDVVADDGHHVALAGLGVQDPVTGTGPPAWVPPTGGAAFAARASAVCNAAATGGESTVARGETDVAADGEAVDDGTPGDGSGAATDRPRTATGTGGSRPDGGRRGFSRLIARLPPDTQVLFCTPALDDGATAFVEALRTAGFTTTVLSPGVTADSVGGRVAAVERATRLDRCRSLGAAVVDWDRDEQLPTALARTLQGEH